MTTTQEALRVVAAWLDDAATQWMQHHTQVMADVAAADDCAAVAQLDALRHPAMPSARVDLAWSQQTIASARYQAAWNDESYRIRQCQIARSWWR